MEPLIIATTIFVWLPICMIFVTKLIWNLSYLQSQDYQFPSLRSNLRWDSQLLYEPVWMILVKLSLFCAIAVAILVPGNAVVILGMVLTYALWIHQSIEIVQKISTKMLPRLELNLMNILNMGLQGVLVVSLILILAIPLLANTFPTNNFNGYYLSYLLPQSVNGLTIIPDFYLFLICSFLLGIALDLGSPMLTLIGTFISRPVQILYEEWQMWDATKLLEQHPKIVKVLITGTLGKTTIKQYLSHILKEEVTVISPLQGENYPASVANFIIHQLHQGTEAIVVDANITNQHDLSRIADILKPQIVVFTGIDEDTTSSRITDLFFQYEEMFKALPQTTKLFINLDNEPAVELARKYNRLETFYGFKNSNVSDLKHNQMTLTTYLADESRHNKGAWDLEIDWGTNKVNLELPKAFRHSKHSLLASIAVALELGISFGKIEARLNSLEQVLFESQIYAGDNGASLLYTRSNSSINSILHDINLAAEIIKPKQLVLITGPNQKVTNSLRNEIKDQIKGKINTLITYNQRFANEMMQENTQLEIITVRSHGELIYQTRQYMNPETCIVLSGIKDPLILKELSHNIS